MDADPRMQTEFEVEAALLINEGGVQCVPVVFARLLRKEVYPSGARRKQA